jgi:hypothetical protein
MAFKMGVVCKQRVELIRRARGSQDDGWYNSGMWDRGNHSGTWQAIVALLQPRSYQHAWLLSAASALLVLAVICSLNLIIGGYPGWPEWSSVWAGAFLLSGGLGQSYALHRRHKRAYITSIARGASD